MATFGDVTGDLDDRCRVVLGEEEDILVAESYEVSRSILTQPSTFTLKFGWGDVLRGLIAKVTPGRKFQLFVGEQCVQTGFIDGYEASSDGNSGGSLSIHGRDMLAPLHDAFIEVETSFKDSSYFDMVDQALTEVYGLEKKPELFGSNDTNLKLTTGIGVKASGPGTSTKSNTGPTAKQLKTRIGERVYEFLKRELDRAGLFLWAAGDGSFVLSAPNADKDPLYRILRQRDLPRNAVNVEQVRYRNATEGRYTDATINSRAGGRKSGRIKVSGSTTDDEMSGWFGEGSRPLVLRDVNITNTEQAEFYALRKLAETRRAGWSLTYIVAGHTIPSLQTNSRAVWAPDTTVDVQDDELGISGKFYIEKVVFKRGPATTTELTLQRPGDLVFGKVEGED